MTGLWATEAAVRKQCRRVGRAGFTLVELLVVLGIIVVLISLLMPAVIGVRRKAQAAVCAGNLRSIGIAMTFYTNRYGYYPAWCVWDDGPRAAYSIWQVRLREFADGEQRVFDCPAQPEEFWWDRPPLAPGALGRATAVHARYGYRVGEPLIESDSRPFSYGYNAYGTGASGTGRATDNQKGLGGMLPINPLPLGDYARELRASRVRKPAQMIAVTDTGDGRADSVVSPNPSLPGARPGTIHNGGANVLFCDGHVQRYHQKELLVTYNEYVPSEHAVRRMWNNDHKVNGGVSYDLGDGG